MIKKLLLSGFICLQTFSLFSQEKVLFTIEDDTITLDEFAYVFNKNNTDGADKNMKGIEEYLDLYINFRLKVKEARDLRVDTLPKVKSELISYRDQLIKSYVDKEILEDLIETTYDRHTKDRKVAHILIKVGINAEPADTLIAWKKIKNLEKKLKRGDAFEKLAVENSEDPSVNDNKGVVGYITAMQIPFIEFENRAFETPVGKISGIFRTRLGYHILKVKDERPAMGKIKVAHILFKAVEVNGENEYSEALGNALKALKEMEEGATFKDMVAKYSEDKASAAQDGVLPIFGVGRMVEEFEKAAFALENPGDISAPVQTKYGIHLIKLIEKQPVASFDDMKGELETQLKSGERYNFTKGKLVKKYQATHAYMEFPDRKSSLVSLLDSSIYKFKWLVPEGDFSKSLFVFEDKIVNQQDFLNYVEQNQRRVRYGSFESIINKHYENFVEEETLVYGLSKLYPEFSKLDQEYKDGILLFELTEHKVWTKAVRDTSGLLKYYEEHVGDYMWKERAEVEEYVIKGDENLEKWAEKVEKWIPNKSPEEILARVEKKAKGSVSIKYNVSLFEKEAIDLDNWSTGIQKVMKDDMEGIIIRNVVRFVEPMPKKLEESRGYYIADYQDHLEKQWINELRNKYVVELNKELLKELSDSN